MARMFMGLDSEEAKLSAGVNYPDVHTSRIIAYLMSPASGYGTVTENVQSEIPNANWTPGEGETEADRPTTLVQQWVTRPATPEESARAYADGALKSLFAATVAWERAEVARKEAEKVPDIPIVVQPVG